MVYFIDRAFDRPIQFFGKFALAFFGTSVRHLRRGGRAQIRLRYFADPDPATLARRCDRSLRRPLSVCSVSSRRSRHGSITTPAGGHPTRSSGWCSTRHHHRAESCRSGVAGCADPMVLGCAA
jgi:hypothetical protein